MNYLKKLSTKLKGAIYADDLGHECPMCGAFHKVPLKNTVDIVYNPPYRQEGFKDYAVIFECPYCKERTWSHATYMTLNILSRMKPELMSDKI